MNTTGGKTTNITITVGTVLKMTNGVIFYAQ